MTRDRRINRNGTLPRRHCTSVGPACHRTDIMGWRLQASRSSAACDSLHMLNIYNIMFSDVTVGAEREVKVCPWPTEVVFSAKL